MTISDIPLIILAGGFGTRLQSVLKGKPKPMADINGIPFLQLLLENMKAQGFSKFILSLHYESEKIIELVEELKDSILTNCEVVCIVEATPMGTGGAVANVVNELKLKEDFFVVNGDTWLDSGLQLMNNLSSNLIGAIEMHNASRYGILEMDEESFILKFKEKKANNNSGFVNAGIYKLSSELFFSWDGQAFSMERDLFPKLVQNRILKGFVLHSNFIDIGVPEDYFKFCNLKRM
jgi:D-glycero-alpha-D-manno-heptose 1-phosphate guanylyltransferase